jgi:triphosphatase
MAEVELKLAAPSEQLPQLREAIEALGSTEAAATSFLTSTYYDSADLKLRNHHLSLRIREGDGKHVQTVKSNGVANGDLLARGEWEDVIAGDEPDPMAPESGPRFNSIVIRDELRPIFTTSVRRTVIELQPDPSALIEVAIDEGEIRGAASGVAEPLSEVELELKSGEPTAVYDLALRLLDVAPVRIETRSKSERGYRLIEAGKQAIAALHAKPLALEASMTVEGVLQCIGRACISHLVLNEPAALAGDPDGIHQIRVASRRLRSALSALKPMLPAEHHRWALDELKWLADSLAPARNCDVFLESLVKPVEQALPLEPDLKHLAEAAEQRRRAAHESAREVIRSPRYSSATLKLARWVEARSWREQPASEEAARLFAGIGDIAPGLIERRWRQARKRSKRFGELSQDERHKLRIALKKLRYTIEFLESLFDGRRVKSLAKQLRPLQEDLGHLNDIRTAHSLVEEVTVEAEQRGGEIARAGGIILGWHDRGLADQEPKLRKHVRRLRKAKPFWPRPHRTKPQQVEDTAQHHVEAATHVETPAVEPNGAHVTPEAG